MPTDASDYIQPEDKARMVIDEMLTHAGWVVQDYKAINLYAGPGVAVRELVTDAGPADNVLFANRKAVGAIEAKGGGGPFRGWDS
jgi:type I restriction enzyme R subunit